MNFKIHGKSAIKNHQQEYAVLFKINLYLVGNRKTSIQISKKHLITFSYILRERNYLRRLNMLMNANLKNCKVKMNWHINVRKKSEDNKSHASYFENGCKYMETKSPMSYTAHQANILRSEELLQKSQKSLGSIMLKFIKQHKGKEHIERNILKEKCKNSIERFLASVKETICKVNTNEYSKNLHRIVSDEQKIFNRERNIYIGFKSLQQKTNIKEKIKMWKRKTRNKQSIYANQKLQFRNLFTYQKNRPIQKVYLTHKKTFNIQKKKNPVFQTKIYRDKHLIQKWGSILRKESKFGENESGTLFKNCYMHFSTINLKFLTITICMKQEFFSSKKYQTQQLTQVKKMLRYLLPSSERVKKKYFSLSPKALEMSSLKIPMVKWLVKKEGFPDLIYFHKDIFNGPSSTVERTKRSAKHKTESISVGALRHLSNALIAGATIFGIALFIIVLGGFYLYLKRRLVLKFLNTVLKDGKSSSKSKSTDSQGYAPISVSQNFHFVQPKDSRKKQTADVEALAKTNHVTVKEIYDSTDTEGSSKKSHRGLTVRSRAYVFPSRSNGSVQSFYDDVCDICSAQFSLSDEFVEKPYSNLPSTTPKAKEAVSVSCQTNHCLKDEQISGINTDMSPQFKKPTISRSKSENDIVRACSSNTSRPVQSLTHVSEVQNP
ncbi:uncharacterized protein LOC120297349 isoform X2 [Crotalus tigris]|nr:uncharacterized protein LOC120297349 isoform X2 [Crotalus tigris]XP_039175829.1 uncharacterized protein LOC120297349 isoform X2 [Crotalus tigris]XP_039175830.1 uncharacterized protein LOC120297349 isoform X2 [Crotalus tigris]XP_039175832.1 uncharacterized protein LOC120297349 isoform X2 [Crotalus tigris]XP_039175833.1 uncharacterized protein LOC120297349 isoform X2 [Crotalus tigris]XP_039175834.1 uncharacterized protein LOC120297349 isoform X2 [Crotalus tigris]